MYRNLKRGIALVVVSSGVATGQAPQGQATSGQTPPAQAPAEKATAEKEPPVERSGLVGSVTTGVMRVSVQSDPETRWFNFELRAGLRVNPLWWAGIQRLQITPHMAFAVTDIRGLDSTRNRNAFAEVDPGLQLSFRAASYLRPYVFVRSGTRTAERVDTAFGGIRNYSGHGTTTGFGVEIPLRHVGSGVDAGVSFLNGRFTSAERLKTILPADVPYRVQMLYVGWSGALRGM